MKKMKMMRTPSLTKLPKPFVSTCPNDQSGHNHSDTYKVHHHNKGRRGLETVKPVLAHYIVIDNHKNYFLVSILKKHDIHISGKVAKWASRMHVQMKWAVFAWLGSRSNLSIQ